ncbi:MAG TPA: ribonucleotide reductase subunit alpha [Rhodocyclaceae bacterium]
MKISTFDDLLKAARQQPEPQQLLFVFTRSELPEGASRDQRRQFQKGKGGALVPVMFVDKPAEVLNNLAELVAESKHTGQDWEVVFVGGLSGRDGRHPDDLEIEKTFETMVKCVQGGIVEHLLAFRKDGTQVTFG